MNSFNKFHKLLLSLFAVIAVTLAGSHFCSAFNNMANHHASEPTGSVEISYSTSYQECCMNKTTGQFTASAQQVQKFTLDNQHTVTAALYALPIFTAAAGSASLSSTPQATRPDPGGLVLRC